MKRREFIAGLTSAAAVSSLPAVSLVDTSTFAFDASNVKFTASGGVITPKFWITYWDNGNEVSIKEIHWEDCTPNPYDDVPDNGYTRSGGT